MNYYSTLCQKTKKMEEDFYNWYKSKIILCFFEEFMLLKPAIYKGKFSKY